MKFPSIFKLPRHQRFHMEPRYYDPVKEELQERERRIIAEINAQKKAGTYMPGSRISGSFSRNAAQKDESGLMRFVIATLLFGGAVGYLYFGILAIYAAFGLGMMYFFVKRLKML